MGVLPHHQEIDTPWEPEPIIWRDGKDAAHKEALEARVRLPEISHIVREVHVADVGRFGKVDPTLHQVKDILSRTEAEFDRLIEAGFLIAPHEWHVTQDHSGRHRTLARVAIIDGFKLSQHTNNTENALLSLAKSAVEAAYELKMERYYETTPESEHFDGHGKHQYIYGSVRTQQLAKQALYLVDIEPVFFTLNPDKL